MKSSRTAITLAYDERFEVESGVWENRLVQKKVRAEQEPIYQRRLDNAMQEGIVITARFSVRSNLVHSALKYVNWEGKNYKVNMVNEDNESHYAIIELGELI